MTEPRNTLQLRIRLLFLVFCGMLVFLLVFSTLVVTRASERLDVVGSLAFFIKHKKAMVAYRINTRTTNNGVGSETLVSQTGAKAVPVLLYHGEGGSGDISQSQFRDQMLALKRGGWQTITLKQFENFIKSGAPVPTKSFLLTFDDGRTDTFYSFDPVLKDLGYNAVMFVITGFSLPDNSSRASNSYYLNKTELRYMAASGRWELHSHGAEDHRQHAVPSVTSSELIPGAHFLSNKFLVASENRLESTAEYTARVTQDLADSRQVLEQAFGKPVTAFAYPFSDYGQDSVNFPESKELLGSMVSSIYTLSFYQVNPDKGDLFNYPDPDAFMIKRVGPHSDWSGTDLLAVLDVAGPKKLPYQASFFGKGWLNNWGSMDVSNNLRLSAVPDSSGASALLYGTTWWTNYVVYASTTLRDGTSETILVRYRNEENRASCTFLEGGAQIEQVVNGVRQTIARNSSRLLTDLSLQKNLGAIVSGNYLACAVNGVIVTAVELDYSLASGAFGFSTWDMSLGVADMTVHSVEVTQIDASAFAIKQFLVALEDR